MATRNVIKHPATLEDMVVGNTTISQTRGGTPYTLNQVDLPLCVDTTEAMQDINVTMYRYARVFSSVTESLEYRYDNDATEGEFKSNTGAGYWVQVNKLPADFPVLGTFANPYPFTTVTEMLAYQGITTDQFAYTLGAAKDLDGKNAIYRFVAATDAGPADGRFIFDYTDDIKAILMYEAPQCTDITVVSDGANLSNVPYNYPYEFEYPRNALELSRVAKAIANRVTAPNDILDVGLGGSTWHTRPVAVGREEEGVDVVYVGDTYGTPEKRDQTDLPTNERLGEAVSVMTKVEYGPEVNFTRIAINDRGISYREDEHMQPNMIFNNVNGQIIAAWGARNSADAENNDGVAYNNISHVRYGYDLDKLSESERVTYDNTTNYTQLMFFGRTAYMFSRVNTGQWEFSRGSGGQNWVDPTQFFIPGDKELGVQNQFYIDMSAVDKSKVLTDPQGTDRSLVHMFGFAHPTFSPDSKMYYCKGTLIPAYTAAAPFDGGGVYVTKVDGVTPISGTNGRLDTDFEAFERTAMDEVYTIPAGRTARVLDIQYANEPRMLIAEFDFNWDHGDTIPFGTTWDLVLIQWNGVSWTASTIESGLRGFLGYDPAQSATGVNAIGVEGYTSGYALGASFYRGRDYEDVLPKVYVCDRETDAKDSYRMRELTLNAGYTAKDSETNLVTNSAEILYRPEMVVGGNKRVLTYNAAQGWSSFNSYTANRKLMDLT